jgi:Ca2+/H+ antiporter, TMEM165/GDT1 family
LFLTVAVASSVEAVEALTIVLASGITRGWRSTFEGVFAALAALTVIVVVVGTTLIYYIPLSILRIVIGTLLLIFGLQWLTKAIRRASGFKALHDEADIYNKEVAVLSEDKGLFNGKRDSLAFVVSFKGVFLEGMEVVMIVISFGLSSGSYSQLKIAAIAALAASAIIAIIGAVVSKPLSMIPENDMKLGVGVLLTVFGTFWMGEGAGVEWPLGDVFILVLVVIIAAATLGLMFYFKQLHQSMLEVQKNVVQ